MYNKQCNSVIGLCRLDESRDNTANGNNDGKETENPAKTRIGVQKITQ